MARVYTGTYYDNPEHLRHRCKNGTTSDKVIYACIDGSTEYFKHKINSYCFKMDVVIAEVRALEGGL